ncbi:helix-turn-helix domain-containing protein [Anaerocolumna sp. AGMB13020]|uniref:PucR family transcriptional regulator n=1 Tax=Anaerocolumna sp. AGMB13020 TaxID=3081750 RepID=UPI0029542400|nr:helix-turn-helix domain-containing protein [Anaerocolumna sp. AGMB13020]WOO37709.1 helix-turn-helix domain-containing protein [Anaerocolumna sp. AGMB13020]
MTFKKLIERISKEYRIDILSEGEDTELQDIALIDGKDTNIRKNTLYFGYDKQMNKTVFLHNCILACTGSGPLPLTTGCNAARVAEEELFSLFNMVKNLIETTRSKGIYEELTALADSSRSIEAVIDAASVRLGSFLVFCDMNFKIIAKSNSIPVHDPLWIENTVKGYCSYEFIHAVKDLTAIKNASMTTSAFEVVCSQSSNRKISCKVFHNKTQIGFLLMIEGDTPFLPSHFEMLRTISHAVSYTIAYYTPDLFEENSRYHELLYSMLIGAPAKDIANRLSSLTFPGRMLALYLRPARYLGQQYLKNYTSKALKHRIAETHVTYHKNGIAAVIPLPEEPDLFNKLPELLRDLAKKEYVRIGISYPFTKIENFVNHFDQAFAALELGQKLKSEEPICFYQDYQFFHLLTEAKSPDKLGSFCHPALAALRQYDHANNSQLYKTLCVYIEKGCNIKLTSESLFIHRNSLVYRLDRITEICGIDLSDINTLFLLRLSFLVDRYNELNTSIEWG